MTDQISEAFSLRPLPDREALIQVIRRNGLIIEGREHGNRAARLVVNRNPVHDSINSGSARGVEVISIAFRLAVRPRELGERSIRAPTFRQQAIVLYWTIESDEAGRDLPFRIGHQLFITMHSGFLGGNLIVRLELLASR